MNVQIAVSSWPGLQGSAQDYAMDSQAMEIEAVHVSRRGEEEKKRVSFLLITFCLCPEMSPGHQDYSFTPLAFSRAQCSDSGVVTAWNAPHRLSDGVSAPQLNCNTIVVVVARADAALGVVSSPT